METPMPARNVEQEFDALKADFGKLSSDFTNLAEAMRNLTGEEAQEFLKKGRDAMGKAQHEVAAGAAALGAHGRQGIDCAARQIRERPLTSILICLGVGFVIGKLIDRRG
jgi:ElaB/YqjD/DUF883 family membrane-anchored ribosome-binding protein